MIIKGLKLINFRNYDQLDISFSKDINFIIGKNAQGKTNILESIYLLSIGKSFRTNKDKEMIMFDKEECYVKGIFSKCDRDISIEIFLKNDLKKGIKINKINIEKFSQLLGTLNTVMFSPEDLKLVKDGPKERRRFIDREISQVIPKYYYYLSNYNKILMQRNKLLKSSHVNEILLDTYDEQMVKYGIYIYVQRKIFIDEICKISNSVHKKLTSNLEDLKISYENQIGLDDINSYECIKSKFYELLKNSRFLDIKNRNTKYGPHKDDLQIYINSLNTRIFGSQGQQRTASISLKLSQIEFIKRETKENPVVLLDDIFSELDDMRQKMLIDNLEGLQVFVTSAEESHKFIFKDKNVCIYNVSCGEIDTKIKS